MKQDIEVSIKKCLKFLQIRQKIQIYKFEDHKQIPDADSGVYVIAMDSSKKSEAVYVGKGDIKARQIRHAWKAYDRVPLGHAYPKGWQWLAENITRVPENWTVYYVHLDKETAKSAMEGSLIHMLQPLANDETFKDENREISPVKSSTYKAKKKA
jgi:hypothetical protein